MSPFSSLSFLQPTQPGHRTAMRSQICDVMCNGKALGYTYCGYRDCSFDAGDYVQSVGKCDPRTATRQVSYAIRNGSSCLRLQGGKESADVTISCDFTPFESALGVFCAALAVFGIVVSSTIMAVTYFFRHEKVLRRSQLIFVYIFLVGSIALNVTNFFLLGVATDATCLLRPWVFNLTATIM